MNAHSEQVRQRAYRIWENEGRPHGRDLDHWLRAEREVTDTPTNGGDVAGTSKKKRPLSSRPRARSAAK